jgi:hexulose-6-phosphate isomerase
MVNTLRQVMVPESPSRRRFLASAAAMPLAAATSVAVPAPAPPRAARQAGPPPPAGTGPAHAAKRAVLISMLPPGPFADRFGVAKAAGFEAIEMQTLTDPAQVEEARAASASTGVAIHSVMNAEHWRSPLSSADRAVVDKSVAGMETSLRNAKAWGAGVVLLVPAVVDPQTSYQDAWTRSQRVIRERILPLAAELKVVVAVEEVWNRFLLSPLEMARYVDEFDSPWVKAYFDVGNVVLYGYPQDWIRTLGPRIVRVHLKDFTMDRGKGTFAWKNLGEGDVDWPAVRQAFADVGFTGYMTTELAGGDAAYIADVAARVSRWLTTSRPV